MRDAAENEAAVAGDHGHFAGKFAGVVRGHFDVRRRAIGLHDLHGAGEHDEEGNVCVAGLEENLARMDAPDFGHGVYSRDLSGGQYRKGLGARVERAWN